MLEYSQRERNPENFVPHGNWGALRQMPAFVEPGNLLSAPQPHSGERLMEPTHTKIINLNSHKRNGCDGATPTVLLRESVNEKLYRVADSLPDLFGLVIFDGWRPLELQRTLYTEARDNAGDTSVCRVEEPSAYPGAAPSHLTGGALDVTLAYEMEPLTLGTLYHEFTPATTTNAFEMHPGIIRDLRRLLYWSLAAENFVVSQNSWWHFEYGTRKWATLKQQQPIYGATS